MTSPAEELRAAAARIREVADGSTPGPWCDKGHLVTAAAVGTAIAEPFWTDTAHIAMWDPIVAVLVADILTIAAVSAEAMEWQNSREGDGRTRVLPSELDVVAIALARAINGSAS